MPTDASNQPVLSAAAVKPEDVHNFEVGVKTEPFRGVTANVTVYNTEIKNFQTQVTNASVGVLRGYLANAEKVRVRGAEFDGNARSGSQSVDLRRRGIHRRQVRLVPRCAAAARGHRRSAVQGHLRLGAAWHLEVGGLARRRVRHGRRRCSAGRAVLRRRRRQLPIVVLVERDASQYLVVDGYSLLNARVGFRAADGWTVSLWSRNLLNKDYYELLTAAPGNTGLYVGQPGDRRTIGVTLRMALKGRVEFRIQNSEYRIQELEDIICGRRLEPAP